MSPPFSKSWAPGVRISLAFSPLILPTKSAVHTSSSRRGGILFSSQWDDEEEDTVATAEEDTVATADNRVSFEEAGESLMQEENDDGQNDG